MLLTMDDLSLDISSEELIWLQASAVFDDSPLPPPKDDDDIFMQDLSLSGSFDSLRSSLHPQHATLNSPSPNLQCPSRLVGSFPTPSRSSMRPNDSPRSEWIYRRPRSPASSNHRSRTCGPYPRPSTGYTKQTSIQITPSCPSASVLTTRIATVASSRPSPADLKNMQATTSTSPFWSSMLRTRPRSERSIPLLKTIPSDSQVVLSPPDLAPVSKISSPKRISAPKSLSSRPPSASSTLSSATNSPSPSSSRSESPVTPISIPYTGAYHRVHRRQRSYHRRHRTHPDSEINIPPTLLSQSCPSKSILTRTSSVSTKASSHTVNKSVKFAANATVHYAGQDDHTMSSNDEQAHGGEDMGFSLDVIYDDDQSVAEYRGNDTIDMAMLRELHCTTPTPELERAKTKGIKRLMTLSKRITSPEAGTDTLFTGNVHKVPLSQSCPVSPRPIISTPFPLGTTRAQAMQSVLSLKPAMHQNLKGDSTGSTLAHPLSESRASIGSPSLRTAPSCESIRSSKSAAARSVRSLGSVKSTSSTRGFRAWLVRTVGWTES